MEMIETSKYYSNLFLDIIQKMKLEDLRSKLMQEKLKDKIVISYLSCNKKQLRGKYCIFCRKKGNSCSSLESF